PAGWRASSGSGGVHLRLAAMSSSFQLAQSRPDVEFECLVTTATRPLAATRFSIVPPGVGLPSSPKRSARTPDRVHTTNGALLLTRLRREERRSIGKTLWDM